MDELEPRVVLPLLGYVHDLAGQAPVLSHELDEELGQAVPGPVVFALHAEPRFGVDGVTEVIEGEGAGHRGIRDVTQLKLKLLKIVFLGAKMSKFWLNLKLPKRYIKLT